MPCFFFQKLTLSRCEESNEFIGTMSIAVDTNYTYDLKRSFFFFFSGIAYGFEKCVQLQGENVLV